MVNFLYQFELNGDDRYTFDKYKFLEWRSNYCDYSSSTVLPWVEECHRVEVTVTSARKAECNGLSIRPEWCIPVYMDEYTREFVPLALTKARSIVVLESDLSESSPKKFVVGRNYVFDKGKYFEWRAYYYEKNPKIPVDAIPDWIDKIPVAMLTIVSEMEANIEGYVIRPEWCRELVGKYNTRAVPTGRCGICNHATIRLDELATKLGDKVVNVIQSQGITCSNPRCKNSHTIIKDGE